MHAHTVLQRDQRPQVHELRHGILQALPQAKPSYGGARCPRIAYSTLQIYHSPSLSSFVLVFFILAHSTLPVTVASHPVALIIACFVCSKNTTLMMLPPTPHP